MTATTQCDRCDDAHTLIDAGTTSLEDLATTLGAPAPSLQVHLIQHGRDDLLAALTYGGRPILEDHHLKAEQAAKDPVADNTVLPEPAEEVTDDQPAADLPQGCDTTVPVPATDLDPNLAVLSTGAPGRDLSSAGKDIQPMDWSGGEDAELADRDQWAKANPSRLVTSQSVVTADDEDPLALVDSPELLVAEALTWLSSHPDTGIAAAAIDLAARFDAFNRHREDMMLLEQLIAQRDQLTDQIDRLAARLRDDGDSDGGVAAPPVAAEIRAWCRDHQVPCPATGRIPRSAVDAYLAAHGGAA